MYVQINEKLKMFYQHNSEMENIHRTKPINGNTSLSWITLVEISESEVSIGIDEHGYWIVEIPYKVYIVDTSIKFLLCVKILETPIERVKDILSLKNRDNRFDMEEIFPFIPVIKFALVEMRSDYWIELALEWFSSLSIERKVELHDELIQLYSNKFFSQKNRHKAKKELAALKRQYHLGN